MIGSTIGIVLDLALMALLGVAIYYGVRLNRQVAIIRAGREQLESLIKEFATATGRAETALGELKTEVGETLDQARQSAHKAGALCDDLEFLIKRGEKLADGLEGAVRSGRSAPAPGADTGPATRSAPRNAPSLADPSAMPSPVTDPEGRALAARPEDRPVPATGQPAKDSNAAKKARAKSKSDLLKALQDMR